MKTIGMLKTLMAGAVLAVASMTINAQSPVPRINGGVGPAIAGSVDVTMLPADAQKFLTENFFETPVVDCERDFSENSFEVELSDGTEIEFNGAGQWTEVDAGPSAPLQIVLVEQLLPEKAFREIKDRNILTDVEKIQRTRDGGFKVELRKIKIDNLRFSDAGRLIK